MTQRSSVTLEPIPTIQELVKTLLDNFMDNGGHGDFYDLTKVLYSTSHEEIAKALIYQAEDVNERAMLKVGLCPECGSTLEWREIKANRTDPGESWLECQTCQSGYERKVG
jgi:formate dehydrogenase maturation protein FdhE